jgi:hypothetical protein
VELRATFPSLFDSQEIAINSTWSLRKHVRCPEGIMDVSLVQDDLPQGQ